jgi:hypothetical protein
MDYFAVRSEPAHLAMIAMLQLKMASGRMKCFFPYLISSSGYNDLSRSEYKDLTAVLEPAHNVSSIRDSSDMSELVEELMTTWLRGAKA